MMREISRKEMFENRLRRMKDYARLKMEEEDWHGVADAAMDIREIIAKLEEIDEREKFERNNRGPEVKKTTVLQTTSSSTEGCQ